MSDGSEIVHGQDAQDPDILNQIENQRLVLNPKKTRKSFSITRKLEILSELESNVPGKGFKAVASRHGIDSKTLREWKKNHQKYLSETSINVCIVMF
jgi:Transposase